MEDTDTCSYEFAHSLHSAYRTVNLCILAKMSRKLIFDLDGTISDPSVGIGRSINYALEAFRHSTIDEREVSPYIGPPLDLAFRRAAPTASEAEILAMVSKYRERYSEVGYLENVVYPGIPEALETLSSQGIVMGVCTSKRVDFAERILVHFGLRGYFEFVRGGDIGVRKEDQLRMLVEEELASIRSTMIGDRAVDVEAARAKRMHAVGVLWGHGSREELSAACPDRLLDKPDELRALADGF